MVDSAQSGKNGPCAPSAPCAREGGGVGGWVWAASRRNIQLEDQALGLRQGFSLWAGSWKTNTRTEAQFTNSHWTEPGRQALGLRPQPCDILYVMEYLPSSSIQCHNSVAKCVEKCGRCTKKHRTAGETHATASGMHRESKQTARGCTLQRNT